jgi:hypothetical protein
LVKVQIQPHQRCDVGFVRQPAGASPSCFVDTLRYGVKDQDVRVSATSRVRVTCYSKWPLTRSWTVAVTLWD